MMERIKISAVEVVLRICVTGLIAFCVYGLFIQFIFSYLNQSISGPRLTFLNFAGPFLLTIVILFIIGLHLLFGGVLKRIKSLHVYIRIILNLLLFGLLVWQIWYTIICYQMKLNMEFMGRVYEVLPMVVGIFSTGFIAIAILKRKYVS